MKNLSSLLFALSFVSSCTTYEQRQKELMDRFYNLTTDYFEGCTAVSGKDDPLEARLTFSTRNCYKAEDWNDQFLRGYVNKNDMTSVTIQVYTIIYSWQGRWIHPHSANFLINSQLNTVDGLSILSDINCTSFHIFNSCVYIDHYAFYLPAEIFAEAQRLKASGEIVFNYRIKTRAGGDQNREFHVNELLGFGQKIEKETGITL